MQKVHLDDLDQREISSSLYNVYYNDKPFTGIGFEYNGDHYTEYSYVNGEADGYCYSEYLNGQKMHEFYAKEGFVVGEEYYWYPDGKLKKYIKHDTLENKKKKMKTKK